MKRWYKKINRGFLLAGILLIGLIAYITVGTIQFNKEKENAKKIVEDYIQSSIDFALNKDASNDQAKELMNRFWQQENMRLQDGGVNKEDMEENISRYLKEKSSNLEQFSGLITEYQLSKYGRNGALCQVSCTYDVTLNGKAILLFPERTEVIEDSLWKESGLKTGQKAKINEEVQMKVYLKLEKEGWRIIRITTEMYNTNGLTAA